MKKFIKLVAIILTIVITGCSSDNEEQQTFTENLSLTSPKGIKIADNEQELMIKLNIPLKKDSNEFLIEDIQYFEGENYSYTAVSAYVNSEFNSVFLINEIPEGKMILQDKHSLRIVDKGTRKNIDGDILNFEQKNFASPTIGIGVARCFNGDCCKWEEIVKDSEFNCGCASSNSVIITTSDGCKVEVR